MKLISHSPNRRYQQGVFCPQRQGGNTYPAQVKGLGRYCRLQQKAGGFLDSQQCYDLIT